MPSNNMDNISEWKKDKDVHKFLYTNLLILVNIVIYCLFVLPYLLK